ncbi:MAG TPA: serine hydrolase domain-containing protein [Enhygromyxa sp.]|nr:serine hydrolase domain-containing protein [Enhygromyxa sp.]
MTLDRLLRAAVDDGVFPGCVALIWRDGAQRYLGAHGRLASHPSAAKLATPVDRETVYDLASLTKVLSTTTLVARAIGRGQLRPDDRLPGSLAPVGGRPSLRDLLEHAAGLEAHREFFHEPWSLGPGRREPLIEAVREVPLACPPRTRAIYTDLGFLLLGGWLEQLGGARLDLLFREQIAEPLGVADQIGFCPLDRPAPFPRDRVAPTEVYEGTAEHWHSIRARLGQPYAHAIVHDDNCVIASGVAGHAGLFGTVAGVLAIARAWLERRLPGVPDDARDRVWELFSTPSSVPGSTRRLGFDGPSPDGSGSTGTVLSGSAIGHLGFTGTSVWIDAERQAIYILLSNRVHPSRHDQRIRELRQRFHAIAATI